MKRRILTAAAVVLALAVGFVAGRSDRQPARTPDVIVSQWGGPIRIIRIDDATHSTRLLDLRPFRVTVGQRETHSIRPGPGGGPGERYLLSFPEAGVQVYAEAEVP